MTNVLADDIALFSRYMALTHVPSLEDEPEGEPPLRGKRLGLVHGSSWIALWGSYFGRRFLPGVTLVAVGNEAVQLGFMRAHREGQPCPPRANIDAFVHYSEDLVGLYGVDAILITCSTMNRAADAVREAMAPHRVPVVQIDEAMMEAAIARGGRILVVATHGPTVQSTLDLLRETAARQGTTAAFAGATVEEAFHRLGAGDIEGHNRVIAAAIREACLRERIDVVVLAQLSMSVFTLSYPDCENEFGVPVLTSAETGFLRVKQVLCERA